MATWQLQTAKARFSEVLETAAAEGPQIVTKHGKDYGVIMSYTDYHQWRMAIAPGLVDFLLQPAATIELDVERTKDTGREVEL
ncbi:type II toxin-antitoxin system Phd/YefM family antitoxin [Arthrobacter castelli]|uniref:type II toxin-antitoxin system Phd/YefM family antitoxin n=1 Tax=Arthrobacter castelli TaxID=271431 RepID=UPI00047D1282|nr:type II toxin-antitoxin system Phd/YefM family antitoxin [Arthrobacter castelli]